MTFSYEIAFFCYPWQTTSEKIALGHCLKVKQDQIFIDKTRNEKIKTSEKKGFCYSCTLSSDPVIEKEANNKQTIRKVLGQSEINKLLWTNHVLCSEENLSKDISKFVRSTTIFRLFIVHFRFHLRRARARDIWPTLLVNCSHVSTFLLLIKQMWIKRSENNRNTHAHSHTKQNRFLKGEK